MSRHDFDEFDDDIPPHIRKVYGTYDLEYCGECRIEGKLWDAYSLRVHAPIIDGERIDLLTGNPHFMLVAKDNSGLIKHFSDVDSEITNAIWDQREQLRKGGHKRRPDQYWI